MAIPMRFYARCQKCGEEIRYPQHEGYMCTYLRWVDGNQNYCGTDYYIHHYPACPTDKEEMSVALGEV